MATRFYFTSSATTPPNSPGFAAWSRTTEGVRRMMSIDKDGSAMANKSMWANGTAAANQSALAVQFHSIPLAAGINFTTTDTIKCVIRCVESAANDNINRQPLCLKVYNGTTLQATLKALGAYGPNTTEWNTSLRNKQLADGDTLNTNYTTVAGDYLVLEVGGQVSSAGGTSVTGNMSFGSNSASDLAENETGTAANNPWFEISRDLTFAITATAASNLPKLAASVAAVHEQIASGAPALIKLAASLSGTVLSGSIGTGSPVLPRLGAGGAASTGLAFALINSSNVAVSGENTTAQLSSPPSGTFGGGRIQDDENPTDAVDLGLGQFREDEWVIQATALAQPGATYEFRVVLSDGTPLQVYSDTPLWTVSVTFTASAASNLAHLVASVSGLHKQIASGTPVLKHLVATATGVQK